MLKHYLIDGKEWQFEEGKQPAGAIEVVKDKQAPTERVTEPKVEKPANKARKAENK